MPFWLGQSKPFWFGPTCVVVVYALWYLCKINLGFDDIVAMVGKEEVGKGERGEDDDEGRREGGGDVGVM